MATATWQVHAGTLTGPWSEKQHWSTNVDPRPGDVATINATNGGVGYIVTADIAALILDLNVNSTDATLGLNDPITLTVTGLTTLSNGTIDLTNATATLSTGQFLENGGSFNQSNGDLTVTGTGPTALSVDGGSFTLTGGTINVAGGANFASGNDQELGGAFNAGSLTIQGTGTFLTLTGGSFETKVDDSTTNTVGVGAGINMNAGAVLDFTNAGAETAGGFTNSGAVVGSGQLTGNVAGSGTVEASGGTMDLTSNITSTTQNFDIATDGTLQIDGSLVSGSNYSFIPNGTTLSASGELGLGNTTGNPTLDVSGMNVGTSPTPTNFIDIQGQTVTVNSGGSGTGAGGSVALSNGATLDLSGVHGASPWFVDTAPDAAGTGTDVFLSAAPIPTFTWNTNSGNWDVAGDWTPTNGPPGNPPSVATDVAVLGSRPVTYIATIQAGTTFDIAALQLTSTTVNAFLTVSGDLLTNSISIAANTKNTQGITIGTGGTLDIRNSITNATTTATTQNLFIGPAAGGGLAHLTLGDAVNSGVGINDPNVLFSFGSPGGGKQNAGSIEFSGPSFPTDTTTTQRISNAGWGDSFTFDHANFTNATFTYNSSTSTLTVDQSGSPYLTMDNLAVASGIDSGDFIGAGSTIDIVCYVRGTMLRTPDGELPVEKLRAGKQVVTLVDGQEIPKTVTWLGHRRINVAGHPRPETVAPVRIRSNAFAEGVPHRDLIVSPDHAIFVDGKLICARQLVNGSTIRQETNWTAVDYYHVELDQHAILLAEGLPAESYIDTGNSGFFDNSGAPLVLHPDLTDESGYPTREAGSCVPFVWDEASVRPVWQRLADRAATIAVAVPQRATTTEPNLRLRGKYRERSIGKPIYADSNLVIFVLPRGAERVRLLSRAQSPTEARPWLDDRRTLGVRVKRIVLRGANEQREIPMDHPSLTKGWWDIERDGQVMSRWTDGNAVVPLPKMAGHAMLEIHLAGEMLYAVEAEPENAERRVA